MTAGRIPSVLASMVRALVPRSVRNWLRSPGRTFEWGIDHARFALGRVERLEIRRDWVIRAHPLAVRCAYMAQVNDPEQRAELDAFIESCVPGMRVLDVGAHFGVFSLAALHYGGAGARAVAMDPSRKATSMIALHAGLNAVADRLVVVEACAAQAEGERGMLDTGVIGAGYLVSAGAGRRAGDLSRVRAVSLDTLCRELAFHPTHVKIDVEGDELEVLSGAAGLLSGAEQPIVLLEIHNAMLRSKRQEPRKAVEWLEHRGYACHDVAGGPVGIATFARDVSRIIARVRTH